MNKNKVECDVLVIGAGPAGSLAASMVNQAGFKVRIVEKEKFPRFVIGESLLPRCMEALQEAGLLEAVQERGFQKKHGARFIKDGKVADYFFADQFTKGWSWTWQVPRAEFDETLASTVIQNGVTIDFQSEVKSIVIQEDGSSVIEVNQLGDISYIYARFIIDASGYGRVMPRLFKLDAPSALGSRQALFAHITDSMRVQFDEPDRILILTYAPQTWVWIIPFSNGTTSIGFVGDPSFFKTWEGVPSVALKKLIDSHPYLRNRFTDQTYVMEPRSISSWSVSTSKMYGPGFVLAGNATEFLDPVFSSGVMFAIVSGSLAGKLVARHLRAESVDWENEYVAYMNKGIATFRSYVRAWYDGTLDTIFYANDPDLNIKNQICSVLAGYVWDDTNPYVKDADTALKQLAKRITYRDNHINSDV